MQDAFLWARQASFPAQTLASLRELNHRFLDLAAAHSESPGDLKMPKETAAPIASLSAEARAAAADCPYALFDLRFHDDAHWRARLGESWRIADEAAVADDVTAFTRLALFYAWHLASTPKLARAAVARHGRVDGRRLSRREPRSLACVGRERGRQSVRAMEHEHVLLAGAHLGGGARRCAAFAPGAAVRSAARRRASLALTTARRNRCQVAGPGLPQFSLRGSYARSRPTPAHQGL